MTAIIGLPAGAVDEMAQAPCPLVAVAPTLVYDHKASHDIETDPDWRSRWAAAPAPTVALLRGRAPPERLVPTRRTPTA